MPYIAPALRPRYDEALKLLAYIRCRSELTYIIAETCEWYITHHTANYQHMNEVAGVLFCVRKEFKRRIANTIRAEERSFMEIGTLDAEATKKFDAFLDTMESIETAGELHYTLSEICARYVLEFSPSWNFAAEQVLWVLGQLADDYYDEKLAPYEDGKISTNGDTPGYAALLARFAKTNTISN